MMKCTRLFFTNKSFSSYNNLLLNLKQLPAEGFLSENVKDLTIVPKNLTQASGKSAS